MCDSNCRATSSPEQHMRLLSPLGAHQCSDCFFSISPRVQYGTDAGHGPAIACRERTFLNNRLQLQTRNNFKLTGNCLGKSHPYKTITYSEALGGLHIYTHIEKFIPIFKQVNWFTTLMHSKFPLLYQLYTAMEIKLQTL